MGEDDKHQLDVPSNIPPLEPPKKDGNSPNECATPFKEPQKEGSSYYQSKKNNTKYIPPPGFIRNIGRIANLPKEERQALAAKGGAASAGISKKAYTKCIKCELRGSCRRAFEESKKNGWSDEESRCVYEIEGRQAIRDNDLREYRAFISADPTDLLAKIQTTYKLLEEEVHKDVTYTKLTNLLYLLMNIYRLKFGEKAFIMNVNKDIGTNATLDIKAIMKEMRAEDKAKVIDVDPHPVSNNDDEV